jgi:quinone-modifying oxidoreductase, subunit QmoB
MADTNKIGVFVCTGCHIGQAIDVSLLKSVAGEYSTVTHYTEHPCLCCAEAYLKINDDIHEENLDSLVIAGCAPRHHKNQLTFEGIYTERVDLRERVAWVMEENSEDTNMAATDYLRMGIVMAENVSVPEPYKTTSNSSEILIVGGGISGIQAAIESARAGYPVHLVEREDKLGGQLNNLHDIIPVSGGKQTNLDLFLHEKLDELGSLDKVNIHQNTTVESIAGEPGCFSAKLKQNGKPVTCDIGSVILTSGWKAYDAKNIKELNYGEYKNVITQEELEKMAKNGNIAAPASGQSPQNILFIQCAGSRDADHLPYCSNVCCLTSLKQALYIRKMLPESNVFIIYKDIRTPGKNEHFYREVQEDSQIFLTKGEVASLDEQESGKLNVTVKDNLLGEDISINADLVVAATGMVPNDSDALNLLYRKGPGLPERKYGFPDSHFICFPYETQRTGIYAAGAVRTPQGIQYCMEDASGAVVKAIQCIESMKRGEALHPRSGDLSYPVLSLHRCTDCKRCTEECPFGTYDENEKGTPIPNPNRCRRCGICMGSCPERIINFDNFSINAISARIKSIPIPDEFEEKPRILAFVCENDAIPAFDMAALKRFKLSAYLRIIPVRCIGSVNKIWLSDALSHGYDGILQIGCKPGDDYQCHFITGSELMETRSENIQETLQTMMLEPERIRTEFLEIDEYTRIPEIIADYLEEIDLIGPNPFKDM